MNHLELKNTDLVLIRDLSLPASIGVFDWEKKIKQQLVFNLELYCDFSNAAKSDDINDAVDYAAVCAEIEKLLSESHYQLLEFLAEKVAQRLLSLFAIQSIKLSIAKPAAVQYTKEVGVCIFRERSSTKLD